MSNIVDSMRLLRQQLQEPESQQDLSPIELAWIKQVNPDFDKTAIPLSLVRGVYADVLEYGPNKERLDWVLIYVAESMVSCFQDDGVVIESLLKWYNNCLFGRPQSLGLFMDYVLPLYLSNRYRSRADFVNGHLAFCSAPHSLSQIEGDFKEAVWSLILVVALNGVFDRNSKEERERQHWLNRLPPEFRKRLK